MLISLILAWIAVLLCLLEAAKYIGRISGNRTMNKCLKKTHIPFGISVLFVGCLHGIFAGNAVFASLSDFSVAPVLFTWNWGTACFIMVIILSLTYLMRKVLRKRWMLLHRIATVALIGCLVMHLINVGIQLPGRIIQKSISETTQSEEIAPDVSDRVSENVVEYVTVTEGESNNILESSEEKAVVTFSGAQLADGTYEGSAEGYGGITTVSVTVVDGKAADIVVLSENDSDRFFSQAESILGDIINQQSLNVDAVSGATFSSAGLINAVYDALSSAVITGTLEVTTIDLSSVRN